jgi:hypothetical protein
MIKSALQSSLTNDVKYRNLDTFNVPSNEYLIETVLLGSNTASVTFSNLGQYAGVYKHLRLVISARNNRADQGDDILLRLNNDSNSANYYYHGLYGTGSVAGSENSQSPSGARIMQTSAANFTASAFNAGVCEILDAFSANKTRTMRTLSGLTGSYDRIWLASNLWNSTAALNSLVIVSSFGGSFITGSRFSLYGVTA